MKMETSSTKTPSMGHPLVGAVGLRAQQNRTLYPCYLQGENGGVPAVKAVYGHHPVIR